MRRLITGIEMEPSQLEFLDSHSFCDSGLSDNHAKINIRDKQKVRIIGGKNCEAS